MSKKKAEMIRIEFVREAGSNVVQYQIFHEWASAPGATDTVNGIYPPSCSWRLRSHGSSSTRSDSPAYRCVSEYPPGTPGHDRDRVSPQFLCFADAPDGAAKLAESIAGLRAEADAYAQRIRDWRAACAASRAYADSIGTPEAISVG